ncbi:MAG TPA: FtsX-like permease family protein [Longimicrobiaceae bacterium]|jgi:putative ABC transport system permease protein|nr:FtsX-like permease family protein [Longimicrobiaceae bacterium]
MLSALLLAAALQAPSQILVERRLAESVPLRVGDTVAVRALASGAAARPFVVAGVYERAADPSRISRNEMEVRMHLPDLEALLPVHDRVDRFAVTLRPGASADSAGRWIEGVAFGTRAYGSRALAEQTSSTFLVVSRFHHAIGIVTILASAIFLLCVMVIRVDERKRDMGMLRLIGISRSTVFRAIVLEAIGIAVVGSAAGAGLGVVAARLVNAYYARVYDTTLRFALVTPRIVLLAALLGLGLGAVAGALAAWRVIHVPPQRLGER